MPDISEFFKNIFTENVKRILQPANLLVAFIFLILNLLFIFPELINQNVSIVITLFGLESALQIILTAIAVLVMAFLLSSLSNSILKLMTGELWCKSPLLGSLFITLLQKNKWKNKWRDRAKDKWQDEKDEQKIKHYKSLVSPPSEDEEEKITETVKEIVDDLVDSEYDELILPTDLGNARNTTAIDLYDRYGIPPKAFWLHFWPNMELAIAEDQLLMTRIDNEKATLDFLIHLTFVLVLFAVEQVSIQFFWLQQDSSLLWAAMFLALAYIVYRAAVRKTYDWCYVVHKAFDKHRDKLRQDIGIRQFKNKEDERIVWKKVAHWLKGGRADDGIFSEAPPVSVTSSANVQVTLQCATRDVTVPEPCSAPPAPAIEKIYQYIDYVMLVSNVETERSVEGCKGVADGIYIIVSDPQIPTIDTGTPPTALDWNNEQFTARIVEDNGTDRLLWHIEPLPANGSTTLQYSLASRVLKVSTNSPGSLKISGVIPDPENVSKDKKDIEYKFVVSNESASEVDTTLEVIDSRITLPGKLQFGSIKCDGTKKTILPEKLSKPERYLWKLGKLGPLANNREAVLQYSIKSDDMS